MRVQVSQRNNGWCTHGVAFLQVFVSFLHRRNYCLGDVYSTWWCCIISAFMIISRFVALGLNECQVHPGSPAERAGLQPGDVVVEFGGQQVKSVKDITDTIGYEVLLRQYWFSHACLAMTHHQILQISTDLSCRQFQTHDITQFSLSTRQDIMFYVRSCRMYLNDDSCLAPRVISGTMDSLYHVLLFKWFAWQCCKLFATTRKGCKHIA